MYRITDIKLAAFCDKHIEAETPLTTDGDRLKYSAVISPWEQGNEEIVWQYCASGGEHIARMMRDHHLLASELCLTLELQTANDFSHLAASNFLFYNSRGIADYSFSFSTCLDITLGHLDERLKVSTRLDKKSDANITSCQLTVATTGETPRFGDKHIKHFINRAKNITAFITADFDLRS